MMVQRLVQRLVGKKAQPRVEKWVQIQVGMVLKPAEKKAQPRVEKRAQMQVVWVPMVLELLYHRH